MPATPAWPPASTPRLFIDMPLAPDAAPMIDGAAAHYLLNVMRLKIGAPILLFDNRSGEWLARIADVGKRSLTVRIDHQTRPIEQVPDLWLCFAPVKKARLDWIIEKATELGVARLLPVITERTIVERVKRERLEAQIVEACEQCGRTALPVLGEPIKLAQLLADWPADRALLFADEAGGLPLSAVDAPAPAAILTGPEGGFTARERDLLLANPKVRRIALGPRILRAETAAIAALGLWMARQPRWQPKADAWIPFFLGFNLFVKVIGGFLLQQPALAVNQVYITLLVLLIGLLALQLSLRAALVGSALGLSAFLTAPWFADAAFARLFLGHYVLTAGVCLFVALVREDKDRIAFLQATLLDLERQEVQRLNEQLAEMALRDVLTGLSNRRRFDQALAQEWDRARRNRSALSLLMVDVDHFKAYNDHYGHPAGDQCLVHLAQAMASAVQRPADVVARYGGEEFVVLLPDTDQAGAVELARKLIEQIDQMALPHVMSSTAPHVTVSVGVATQSPLASMDRQGLVGAADAALYRAKRGGRHAVGV